MTDYVDTSHKWLQLSRYTVSTYNAWDTIATARVYKALLNELDENGQLPYYREFFQTARPAISMQKRGIPISHEERERHKVRLAGELKRCDEILDQLSGGHVLFGEKGDTSDLRVAKWLFSPLGEEILLAKPKRKKDLPLIVRGCGLKAAGVTEKTKRPSVDRDNLLKILRDLRKMDEPFRPAIEALIHRSRVSKLIEYLDFPIDPDGRIRPAAKLYGTKTFRYAYSDPPIHSWTDDLRTMVAAPPGWVLVAADYSQLEARIAACLFNDEIELSAFARGEDIHSLTARDAFLLSAEKWDALNPTLRKQHRDWAKTFRYGAILYGGDPQSVHMKTFCVCTIFGCTEKVPDTLNLSRKSLASLADRWFAKHPAVTKWRDAALKQVRDHHFLVSPFGYPMYFAIPWGDNELIRQVFNRPIQSSAATIMNRSQVRLEARGVPIILQHHDSFLSLARRGEVTRIARLMKEEMERPVPELRGMVFPVEVKVGQNWKDLEGWGERGSREASQESAAHDCRAAGAA